MLTYALFCFISMLFTIHTILFTAQMNCILSYCLTTYNTSPDYPFDEDFETAVLRHGENRKWYALVMRVSRRKFGFDSDEVIDVVNLKLPPEMFGSFGVADGVYPAYHMNKLHWISVLLPDAPEEVVRFLVNVSF